MKESVTKKGCLREVRIVGAARRLNEMRLCRYGGCVVDRILLASESDMARF